MVSIKKKNFMIRLIKNMVTLFGNKRYIDDCTFHIVTFLNMPFQNLHFNKNIV